MTRPGIPDGRMQTNEWAPPPQSQRTNRLAIAALICGIFFFFPAALVAIILGHIARGEIRRTGEHGRGLATAGLMLGYVGVALSAFLFVVVIMFYSVSHTPVYYPYRQLPELGLATASYEATVGATLGGTRMNDFPVLRT